jgi:hypothetical protein
VQKLTIPMCRGIEKNGPKLCRIRQKYSHLPGALNSKNGFEDTSKARITKKANKKRISHQKIIASKNQQNNLQLYVFAHFLEVGLAGR